MLEKPVVWLGDCLEAMTSFPADARRIGGFQLWLVQRGEEPRDWKPMPTVGLGVNEIRIHTGVEHRIVYIAKFQEAVYVLHAFEKRARRTPKGAIDLARSRLRELLAQQKAR